MIKSVSFLVITVVVAVLVGGVAHSVPSGGIGGRPARPDLQNSRSQSIFIHTLDRGQSAKDAILVTNSSTKERTIEIYVVDGMVSSGGAYSCRQKSEQILDSGGWIALAENKLTLQPDTSREVEFSITVPDQADVGEHNACVVVADWGDENISNQDGVRIRTRQAVRAAIIVPGDLHRQVLLSDFSATVDSKSHSLFGLTLLNNGNVSADVEVSVIMKSKLSGRKIYQNGGVYPVFSNEKLEVNYENNKPPFWGGWFSVSTVARYNDNPALLGFDPDVDMAEALSSERTVMIMPSWGAVLILIGVVLGMIGLIVAFVARICDEEKGEQMWQDYTVQASDTLISLAIKTGTQWKIIAKTNQIKAPYSLTEGQVIKLPTIYKSPGRGKLFERIMLGFGALRKRASLLVNNKKEK